MKQAIGRLWSGDIVPAEICGAGHPEIEKLVMLIEKHKRRLEQELGQQQKAVFGKYADCAEEYAQMLAECAFTEGFCIACRLVAEGLL